VYAFVLGGPLLLIVGVVKPGARGPLVVFADILGFVALSLLALQVIVSGRWAVTTSSFGLRKVLSLHRLAGISVLALVILHVVILVVDDPTRLALLDSATAPGRARAGMLALLGLVTLAVTSIWRRRVHLSYERWRAIHLVTTAVVLAATFLHVIWVDAYTSLPDVRRAVLGLVVAAAVALFWTRVARRYATAMRSYRVAAIRRERGNAVTLELTPDGHRGLHFQPGQFAWLRAGDCVYGMNDHPFTLSSSAHRPERPAFTVKALGDFSGSLADLHVGTGVFVDGPHGEAVRRMTARRGRVLLAAGIGITPAMSVLRTAVERRERGPVVLLYGSRRWEDVIFREELDELAHHLPGLEVVHVLSQPEPEWQGERGRIGEDILTRYAPPDIARWSALLCGPPTMVSQTTSALRRLGMPQAAIQAEGFA
jgi:3-phenylpropionate/trans-cinnamate dioxygenase ferredoxin reductase subunit